jgi:hypothetical protein
MGFGLIIFAAKFKTGTVWNTFGIPLGLTFGFTHYDFGNDTFGECVYCWNKFFD